MIRRKCCVDLWIKAHDAMKMVQVTSVETTDQNKLTRCISIVSYQLKELTFYVFLPKKLYLNNLNTQSKLFYK